ncbi:MAG TPA: DUF305 domain-containing protein [Longimicrobiaceae bacterium]
MTVSQIARRVLLVALTLAASACAAASRTPAGPSTGTAPSSTAEYEELYYARLDSAQTRYTAADVRFMTDMIHHHAQAIEMSEMVPERTENPRIHTLAGRIINAQNDEIAIMRRWLQDRRQPVPEVAMGAGAHGAHGGIDHSQHSMRQMPGMLSPEEIRQLEQARGDEFDRLFLTGMIRHHQGAVTMVQELFATDGAAQDEQVFKFASDVQVDQTTEVARMQSMLAQLPQPVGGQ